MRIIAVAQQKGGTGKTTATMNLAALAHEAGSRVAVVDVDRQGSATFWAAQSEREGSEGLPFDVTTSTDPAQLAQIRLLPYDVVFVDTPGSLDGEDVLKTVLDHADFVILATEAAPMAIPPLMRTVRNLIEPMGIDYRVLLSRVEPRTAAAAANDMAAFLDQNGVKRFRAFIRTYKIHEDAVMAGAVVTQYPQTQRTISPIQDFRKVHAELLTQFANEKAAV